MKAKADMLVTTTNSLVGYEILNYLGTVSTNVVTGTGLFSDFAASLSDVFGGRSQSYQKQLQIIYDETLEKLKENAKRLGANAIIGLRIDQDEISGKAKQMFMISAVGTAIKIEISKKNPIEDNAINKTVPHEEMDTRLKIQIALKQIQSRKFNYGSKETIELLASNNIIDAALPILINLSEQISRWSDGSGYSKELDCANLFFNTINPSLIENVLYEYFDKDSRLRDFIVKSLKNNQIINYDHILRLLNTESLELKKHILNLLFTYKEFYSKTDIPKIELIIEKLKGAFPNRSSVESKKGLMNSKEVYVCGFCGYANTTKDYAYCDKFECGLNQYGFSRTETKPQDVIDILEIELYILKDIYS